ncbi:MAG: DNA polymerase, partial [Dehalococcoidia bacterium]
MSGEDRPLLALLDGHGIIHRSYHAMREQPLTLRRTGEVITAVYGFANTLLSVLQELKPTHVVVTLDKGRATFRHRWDASYKAQRVEMPADLQEQMARCRQLIEVFGIPIYEHEGYEADDMMGTLSRQASQSGADTFLVSLDSDIAQLVGPGVHLWMYRPYQRDSVVYATEEDVHHRYGVYPNQMVDLKALRGDPSDNIAGVPGVGEKTAVKLIREFGSVEGVYENIERVEPAKLRQALVEAEQRVRQNKVLATIVRDAPVQLDLAASDFASHYQRERVLELFRELEFRSLVQRLPQMEQHADQEALRPAAPVREVEERYQVVRAEEELEALVRRIGEAKAFVFDTETTGLEVMRVRLVGLSIALAPGEAYYLPLGHRTDRGQLPLAQVMERLGPLLAEEAIEKTGHNAKYDIVMLAREGVRTRGLRFDSMIAAFLLGEGGGGSNRPGEGALSLKWLASRRLGIEMRPITDLIGQGRNQVPMSEVDIEAAARYACADADMTGRLRTVLEEDLERQGMWHLFSQVEMPLIPVLARMEMNGVAVDTGALREMSTQLAEEIGRLEEEIYKSVGHSFNIGSPQQLSHVLFEELQLPKTRRLKSGSYTTDAQA